MRSIPPILIQFGGLCVAVGLIVGGGLGWYFALPLANELVLLCSGMYPTRGPETVIENTIDPLLAILDTDPAMTAPAAVAKFFSKSDGGPTTVNVDLPVSSEPGGPAFTTLKTGSCVIGYAYKTRPPGTAKVIYRTDQGWNQGYMPMEGAARRAMAYDSSDCRAQTLPVRTP